MILSFNYFIVNDIIYDLIFPPKTLIFHMSPGQGICALLLVYYQILLLDIYFSTFAQDLHDFVHICKFGTLYIVVIPDFLSVVNEYTLSGRSPRNSLGKVFIVFINVSGAREEIGGNSAC